MSRTCSHCGEPLPTDAIAITKYCSRKCKDAAGYLRNGDKARATQAVYRKQNLERRAASDLARRLADPEKSKARHRANYAADPTAYKSGRDKRRSLVSASADYRHVSFAEWTSLLNRHGGGCAYCGSKDKIEMDHVVPLSKGGRHAIGNLLPACFSCNRSKRARFLSEWKLHQRKQAALVA